MATMTSTACNRKSCVWTRFFVVSLLLFSATTRFQKINFADALNVLVVGGSGRVGGSTVRWLQTYSSRQQELSDLKVQVGCRTKDSFDKAQKNHVLPSTVEFVPMDLDGPIEKIKSAIQGCDLVVHTAGPFQGRTDPVLVRCCVEEKIKYVDVCDEYELAVAAKAELQTQAEEAGVPAVISSGIWPGVSALMASEAKSKLLKQQEDNGDNCTCETLDLSFFTAGTGNAGPTILSATFLLLATPVLTFLQGKQVKKEPWTEMRDVDFGPAVGTKPVWLLDNPDVPTTSVSLDVPNVSSRFGTDPLFWNYLFYLIKAIPTSVLKNRDAMQAFALFSEPIVRVIDKLVGSTNAMRVDAISATGKKIVTTKIVHPDLESCVGLATAAFAVEVLKGTVPAGIWYPAELPPVARKNILEAAKEDTLTYEL